MALILPYQFEPESYDETLEEHKPPSQERLEHDVSQCGKSLLSQY